MGRRKSATEGKWFFDLLFYFFFFHIEDLLSVSLVVFFFFCIGLNEPSLIAGRNGVCRCAALLLFLLKASKCVCMYVSVYLVVRIYQ